MAGLNDLISEGASLQPSKLGDAIGGSSNKELMASARTALSGNWGMALLGCFLFHVFIFSLLFFIWSVIFCLSTVLGGTFFASMNLGLSIAMVLGFLLGTLALVAFLQYGWFNFFRTLASEGAVELESFFLGGKRIGAGMLALFLFGLLQLVFNIVSLMIIKSSSGGHWILYLIGFLIVQFLPVYLQLRYSMMFFILSDDESVGGVGALRGSSEIMAGNKWKLFRLYFRFFWWGTMVYGPYLLVTVIGALPVYYSFLSVADNFSLILGCWIWALLGNLILTPYIMTSFAKFYEDVK